MQIGSGVGRTVLDMAAGILGLEVQEWKALWMVAEGDAVRCVALAQVLM